MEFNVKLERYEGPYTKLLDLIEGRKLSITEISLVTVADDYIAYIKSLDQKNIIDISQFIVVASTLMLMKAKSLLPGITYTEEEEQEVHDLEHKIELYKMMIDAAAKVRPLYGKTPLYLRRHSHLVAVKVFVPDKRINGSLLQSIASMTLLSFVVPKALVKVAVEQALRMENVIEKLLKRVGEAKVISLNSLTTGASTVEEQKKLLIVNFIALLELLRTGAIQANQHSDTGEIHIQARETIPSPILS